LNPILVVLSTLIIAFALTPFFRSLAIRSGTLDVPNERSSHDSPTPRTGGLAIVSAILLSWIFTLPWGTSVSVLALVSTFCVAAAGFLDDVRTLPVLPRFVVQIVSACLFISGGWALQAVALPALFNLKLGVMSGLISVLWIVGCTNAFNFMDGLNGIASLQAVVHASTLAFLAWRSGDELVLLLAAAIAGSVLGFVPWNLPHGSVFMGDVGSATLGFMLSGVSLMLVRGGGASFVAAALAMFPFLFDTIFTVTRRAMNREKVTTAHRTHLYQLLNRSGWSHRRVTALWTLLAGLCGLIAGSYDAWPPSRQVAGLLTVSVIHVLVAVLIIRNFRKKSSAP